VRGPQDVLRLRVAAGAEPSSHGEGTQPGPPRVPPGCCCCPMGTLRAWGSHHPRPEAQMEGQRAPRGARRDPACPTAASGLFLGVGAPLGSHAGWPRDGAAPHVLRHAPRAGHGLVCWGLLWAAPYREQGAGGPSWAQPRAVDPRGAAVRGTRQCRSRRHPAAAGTGYLRGWRAPKMLQTHAAACKGNVIFSFSLPQKGSSRAAAGAASTFANLAAACQSRLSPTVDCWRGSLLASCQSRYRW